jgi:choline dehydrogenase-like flavoprotein
LDRTRLKFGFWRFDMASGRYELDRCGDLRGSRNISVLLHANVTHLQASRDARRIEHVEIKSLHGHRAVIVARNFVLACGGIENPRLLLAANDVEARGVGNRHDHVGRCFMEHPHARAARVDAPDPFRLYQYFQPHAGASGVWIAPSVQASESLQQELEILNTSVTVKLLRVTGRESTFTKRFVHAAKRDLNPTRFGRDMWRHFRRLRQFLRLPGVRKLRWWYTRFDGRELYLFIRGEQAPNPASRLVLSESRDALGVPRASLDWRLTALDKRSAAVLVDTVAGEFARLGLGSVTPEPWLGDASLEWPAELAASSHPIGGYHHMGTTRMSDNPADGVVDRNCRVHGYSNLFVAGSSVFPTSGWANPTLTIVALAHRLGEYLAARMD